MRRVETRIRQLKDMAMLARYSGDDRLRGQCQQQIGILNEYYNNLTRETGLKPEYERTYVAGFRDVKAAKPLTDGANGGIIKAQGDERMVGIHSPIEQRNTGKGNPNAMEHFGRPFNNRQ